MIRVTLSTIVNLDKQYDPEGVCVFRSVFSCRQDVSNSLDVLKYYFCKSVRVLFYFNYLVSTSTLSLFVSSVLRFVYNYSRYGFSSTRSDEKSLSLIKPVIVVSKHHFMKLSNFVTMKKRKEIFLHCTCYRWCKVCINRRICVYMTRWVKILSYSPFV